MCVRMLSHSSHVQLFMTLWTIACQAPLSMGFSRQEYWVCCWALLQIFPTQGLNSWLISPALENGFFSTSSTGKPNQSLSPVNSNSLLWWFENRSPNSLTFFLLRGESMSLSLESMPCDILWPSVSSWFQFLQSSACHALNSCQPALTLLVVPPALGY